MLKESNIASLRNVQSKRCGWSVFYVAQNGRPFLRVPASTMFGKASQARMFLFGNVGFGGFRKSVRILSIIHLNQISPHFYSRNRPSLCHRSVCSSASSPIIFQFQHLGGRHRRPTTIRSWPISSSLQFTWLHCSGTFEWMKKYFPL